MKNQSKDATSVFSFLMNMVCSVSVKLRSMEEKVGLWKIDVLWCGVVCCAVLCDVVLCDVVLCDVVLCDVV